MKSNKKLFNALSNIDEELINEAVNAPKNKRLPLIKFTSAAAVLIFAVLSAVVLVNISKQTDIIEESEASCVQTSEKEENTTAGTKGNSDEGSGMIFTGHYSVPESDKYSETDTEPPMQASTADQPSAETSGQPIENTSDAQVSSAVSDTHSQSEEGETCEILGVIEWNGKTYTQIITTKEYTIEEEIGLARNFGGSYTSLDDESKVYTVKEDSNIIALVFDAGGTIYLSKIQQGVVDGYYILNGLKVDAALGTALSSNDGKAYRIYITRPDSNGMYNYEYNGRTLNDIELEMYECQKMNGILQWLSGQIKDDVFFSGRDDKFIEEAKAVRKNYRINGTDKYDMEKAKEDALSYGIKCKLLYNESQDARESFLKEKIKNIYDILTAQGIKAELVNEVRCEAEITKEQFEALAASNSNLDEYAFCMTSGYYTENE